MTSLKSMLIAAVLYAVVVGVIPKSLIDFNIFFGIFGAYYLIERYVTKGVKEK